MTSAFMITPTPPTSLKLTAEQEGTLWFTVTSLKAPDQSQEVILQALLIGPDEKAREVDWLVPGPQRTLTIGGGRTETVAITAHPTRATTKGEHTIKLAIADKDHPNTKLVYSAPVTCDVVGARDIPPPPPTWPIRVIAGGVVVLGLGIFIIIKLINGNGPQGESRCNPNAPFGGPIAIYGVNTAAHEEGAYLSPDELTMYFSSTRPGSLGGFDIFMSNRSTRNAQWGNIMPVTGVNTAGVSERFPKVTADGLTMYALIGASPNYEIGVANRTSTAAAFTSFSVAATLNSARNDEAGTILPDHSAIWFSSDRGGSYDIYRAPWPNGQFGNPLLVSGTNLNDPSASDAAPVVSPDELTLFFASNREGGLGNYDIWMAKRTRVADGFDAPINLQIVNTPGIDAPTWISADGCNLHLTRGAPGAYELFVASRAK